MSILKTSSGKIYLIVFIQKEMEQVKSQIADHCVIWIICYIKRKINMDKNEL